VKRRAPTNLQEATRFSGDQEFWRKEILGAGFKLDQPPSACCSAMRSLQWTLWVFAPE
jgi:hypothetical protein